MIALDDFIISADQLMIFQTNFKGILLTDQTISSLEASKIELNNLWAEVKRGYTFCLKSADDSRTEEEVTAVKSKYSLCSATYINCLAEIIDNLKKLNTIKEADSSPTTSLLNLSPSPSQCIKVPPCDTETFYGTYLTWPSFRDMFTAVYINHPKLCSVQKLFHLRSKTKGEAYNIVCKFPLTADNFPLAWAALADQYENKRILVNNQLKVLFNIPVVSSESSKQIRDIQREVNDALSNLRSHKISTESWDPILVYLCSNRLPEKTLALWEQSLAKPCDIPTWKDMDSFLTNRYRVLETVSDIKFTSKTPLSPLKANKFSASQREKHVQHRTYHTKQSNFKCKLCKQSHPLRLCPAFKEMSNEDRVAAVNSLQYCTNCLASTHLASDCRSVHTCMQCKQRHHTLLHNHSLDDQASKVSLTPTESQQSTNQTIQSTATSVSYCTPQGSTQTCPSLPYQPPQSQSHPTPSTSAQSVYNPVQLRGYVSRNHSRVVLATALVEVHHLGEQFTLKALIDPASEVTFIAEGAQRKLNLPTKPIQASISGMSDVVTATSSKICSLVLGSKIQEGVIEARAIVLQRLTGDLPSCEIGLGEISDPVDYDLADPFFYESSKVDLVIGADLYPFILKEGVKHNVFGSLLAQNTIFGWVLSGPLRQQSLKSFSTVLSYYNEVSLDQQIAEFWRVEDLPETELLSASDKFCEELYSATTTRDINGRFIVRLPFKNPTPSIGRSREIALKQFTRMETYLSKNPELKMEYDQVLQEYIDLQHMYEIPPTEVVETRDIRSYYLPHHAVVKPSSKSTKVRVVFNASSQTTNGKSLNDMLHTGPTLQTDLMILILKWRFFQFVFNADIVKMYRQILVHPDHVPYQRIVFRTSTDQTIRDFVILRLTFGVKPAPYLAQRTLVRLADEVCESLPLAGKILREDFFVDDVLSGAHDIATALKAQDELIEALDSAGFSLRKWTSNCSDLISKFPKSHLYDQDLLKIEDKSITKTLGVMWNAITDCFHFSVKIRDLDSQITKRAVLSIIASLFDPAGWLAPVIVTAKIIMQQIWKDGTSWDQTLEPLTCHRWKTFIGSFVAIESIQVPRWISYTPDSESVQIHGFCDASEKAYAASLYLRVQTAPEIWSCNLLCAKSKVAPVKSISLPRLELCGAVLLSKLVKRVYAKIKCENYKLFLWTDSSIVLCWLEKTPCTWGTFVGNRISLIQENTFNSKWMHVRSSDNPADLATRGLPPMELRTSDIWWNGPSWLSQAEVRWPISLFTCPDESDLERKPIKANHTHLSSNIEDILQRFSSFPRALHVICYILRFFHLTHRKFKPRYVYKSLELSHSEVRTAKCLILRQTQAYHFPIEYSCLSKGERIPCRSSLLTLNPIMDSEKLIRINGRLVRSALSYSERYPIILPYHALVTSLIVQFIHKMSLHGENQLLIRLTRCEYWIPKIKNLVKKFIRLCKVCIMHRKMSQTQIMAALPPERTTISLPFTITGLDFAGPFTLKSFSGRNCRFSKGYVCLFICFATKAIHLEATSDLTSQSFLAALGRFIARRGTPKTIFSDNGTNLVGASKLIADDFKSFVNSLPSLASEHFKDRALEWKFIPPGAPHMGGLWEAGVRSFKTHFKKIAGDHKFTFEEFSTLLAKVEACLNSRPISANSENPSDIPPLTPGHFLRGGPLLAPPEPDISDMSLSCINRWRKVKILHQQFCRRWKNEYLLELHKRQKWKQPQRNVEQEDIVVVRDNNVPPNEWRLGRVIKVYPGSDSRVRVADIKTQHGVITRPIVKLCVLPSN